MKHPLPLVLFPVLLALSACANRESQMSVQNLWRSDQPLQFQVGKSTQSQVMDALGPPSQVIALHDQTLLYYLREQQKLRSLSLLVYSQSRERITYDRAIFFFDKRGILRDFAVSDEAIPLISRRKLPSDARLVSHRLVLVDGKAVEPRIGGHCNLSDDSLL